MEKWCRKCFFAEPAVQFSFDRRLLVPPYCSILSLSRLSIRILSYVCPPHCHRYPLEDHLVGPFRARKAVQLVCCMVWPVHVEGPKQNLGHTKQYGPPRVKSVFEHTAAPHRVCDMLINAPKLLANQQKDGERPDNMAEQGFLEKIRLNITDGLRWFTADNQEAVKGDCGAEHGVEGGEVEVHRVS